ncbi:hypothetical protein TIFTF001_005283 [Ficus carica]|uniref:Uncharacterized protein n=1 Tax=Ficus carica TaxID=3494 RepID=A0AA88CZ86_FICCA|nr:hypothetical protein TIFTF001_005283 [Ficus carica]
MSLSLSSLTGNCREVVDTVVIARVSQVTTSGLLPPPRDRRQSRFDASCEGVEMASDDFLFLHSPANCRMIFCRLCGCEMLLGFVLPVLRRGLGVGGSVVGVAPLGGEGG